MIQEGGGTPGLLEKHRISMNFTKDFTQDFTIVGEFAIFKQKLETYNRFFFIFFFGG